MRRASESKIKPHVTPQKNDQHRHCRKFGRVYYSDQSNNNNNMITQKDVHLTCLHQLMP